MNTFNLTLDLAKAKQRQQQTIFVRQGDQNGTTIVATITDHGVAASTTGLTARFQMRLPDGTHYYRKAATLSGNVATVTIDEAQAASAVGRTDTAYFQLLQGSTVVASTESFTVIVLPDALEGHTVPESYDSAIQDAIDALGAAVEQMPDMVEDVLEAHPEWTTTVQDGSITKDKLATDLARDRERLLYRLDNLLTAQLPEGETATASDAARTPMAGLALYGRSTQDGTPTPSAPVPIVSVAGNLLDVTATGQTIRGVAYTVDGGVVTANGTASGGNATLTLGTMSLSAGTYALSGITGGSGTTYALRVYKVSGNATIKYVYNVDTFALDADAEVGVQAYVYNGATVSGLTLTPMLVHGSIAYPYVPYGNAGLWAIGRNVVGEVKTGLFVNSGTSKIGTSAGAQTAVARVQRNTDYTLVYDGGNRCIVAGVDSPDIADGDAARILFSSSSKVSPKTFNSGENDYVAMFVATSAAPASNIMLERGTTATAYVPYESTVTPIPLDGHELRSLPDGTRDELTVDERGHAVLVQRVGSVTFDGSESSWEKKSTNTSGKYSYTFPCGLPDGSSLAVDAVSNWTLCDRFPNASDTGLNNGTYTCHTGVSARRTASGQAIFYHMGESLADWKTWLASNPTTLDYKLATPVTHDLGTIDPVPLVGPDLTAQAIPTAPFALTYERDLNTTLARLESAIANLV